VAGVSIVPERLGGPNAILRQIVTLRHNMARILARMDRTGYTEDPQSELCALVLSRMLELFGDSVKPPGKVLPWPKTRESDPGPF
jgi:hypothetical protein